MTEYEYERLRKIKHKAQESIHMDALFLIDKIEKMDAELAHYKSLYQEFLKEKERDN